jgi:hypothetical protein
MERMIVRELFFITCLFFFFLSFQSLYGFDEEERQIEKNLRTLTPENARSYLMPLMETHTANINRATFHTAEVRSGFSLYLGMKAMAAIIPDIEKTYPAFSTTTNSIVNTATVVGNNGNNEFPDGFNWKVIPVMIPHLSIGNLFGTQIFFRYLPSTKFDDKIGDIDVFGGGITHSLSQYIPGMPIDFAVQGSFQYTKLGDMFESSGIVYNFLASAQFTGLTLYGALGFENSEVNVRYNYNSLHQSSASDTSLERITFNETFEEYYRATMGMSLQFIIFIFNADFSFGNYNIASIGFGISL